MKDLANHLQVVPAILPAAARTDNTPIVSRIIDVAGYQSLMFAINIGALAAGGSFAVTMDCGNDPALADAVPVPAQVLTGTLASASFTAANDANKVRKIGYVGSRRYVRLTITPAGNAGAGAFLSAVAVLSDARYGPTPAQSA